MTTDSNAGPGQRWQLFLPRLEMLTAMGLSLWLIILHVINLLHAGPLWRDEAATAAFAAMPTLADLWHNLQYDNFPPLFTVLLRLWLKAGLSGDYGCRLLGFLIGLGTLEVIWSSARMLGARQPLLALAVLATMPSAVRAGDAIRAHGLGVALVILTLALIWRYVQAPGRRHFWTALAAAVLSVQCLYQSAFFVLAFCLAAWAALAMSRQWKTAGRIFLIGFAAAISLLPYWGLIQKGHEWRIITVATTNLGDILNTMSQALNSQGTITGGIILGALVLAAGERLYHGWRRREAGAIYLGTAVLAVTGLYLVFLAHSGLGVQPWYFLILLVPAALGLDALWGANRHAMTRLARITRLVRLGFTLLPAVWSMADATTAAKVRQTNADLVSVKLRALAGPHDLIVVSPWYAVIPVQRYYGANRVATVPPLSEHRIHRYDLIRQAMEAEDPIGPLLKDIEQTLRSGNNVWLVGVFLFSDSPAPQKKPPPFNPATSLRESDYSVNWMAQVAYCLQTHAYGALPVPVQVPHDQPVNLMEYMELKRAFGWRN